MRTILVAAIALLSATSAQAQSAAGLRDLIGARGSSGESVLQSRGYQFVSSSQAKGAMHTFWWSQSRNNCIRVTTRQGRYSNIIDRPALFCGKSASNAGSGHGSGGAGPVYLGDIKGMDGVRSFDAMIERGFRNVDTITEPGTIYGIYYNPTTRQCIQVATVANRVDSVTDIHTHPNCR